jgi:hypothetical protein
MAWHSSLTNIHAGASLIAPSYVVLRSQAAVGHAGCCSGPTLSPGDQALTCASTIRGGFAACMQGTCPASLAGTTVEAAFLSCCVCSLCKGVCWTRLVNVDSWVKIKIGFEQGSNRTLRTAVHYAQSWLMVRTASAVVIRYQPACMSMADSKFTSEHAHHNRSNMAPKS